VVDASTDALEDVPVRSGCNSVTPPEGRTAEAGWISDRLGSIARTWARDQDPRALRRALLAILADMERDA
jgi:hypothetical protein